MKNIPIEINEHGEVFFEGKKCSTQRDTRGYNSVRISLHRMVAHAFHGAPSMPRMVCHHIDGNPRNNRPDNLCWVTQTENTRLRFSGKPKKLSPKQINEILSQKPLPLVRLRDLAETFGVTVGAIGAIRSGRRFADGWHKHNHGKLTAQQVQQIKDWKPPVVTAAMLARKYHVSDTTILNVWHGH